ncbi:MAG: ankyrin repeat domain-containing protein, partial [Candidatus Poribacteria bacterium]|nr:ankyrin repeat domain-containing protein [Candidatus Poribacteria bacterium]
MTQSRLPTDSSSIHWQPELDTDEHLDWNMGVGRLVKATLAAAMDGDLAALRNLIEADPTLVDCNVGYREPLYFAVGNNHRDCVRYLVDNGAEVTYRSGDRTHQRPIERALDRGFDEIANLLKAVVEQRCGCLYVDDGETLAEYIRGRDLNKVISHLSRHPEHIHACDDRGNMPIHWAVLTMNIPMVRALLDRSADVNGARPDGARPIDLVFGDYFFIRRDVPPEALSENRVMLGYLLARGAEYDLRTAASVGDTEEVRRQIAADPQVLHRLPEYFTWYTGTALCNAAMSGHSDIVQLLLEAGANPSQPE